jgi:hypothetical protein
MAPAQGYVEVNGPVVQYDGPVVEFGYEPVLYDGYVVYYADAGNPFIWLNGVRFWIPDHERSTYVTHYQQHIGSYHDWYDHRGDSYRDHRYADRSRDGRRQNTAGNRGRDSQPVLRPAPEARPQPEPKAEPEPKVDQKRKLRKQVDE